MTRSNRIAAIVAALALLFFFTGCSRSSERAVGTETPDAALPPEIQVTTDKILATENHISELVQRKILPATLSRDDIAAIAAQWARAVVAQEAFDRGELSEEHAGGEFVRLDALLRQRAETSFDALYLGESR